MDAPNDQDLENDFEKHKRPLGNKKAYKNGWHGRKKE